MCVNPELVLQSLASKESKPLGMHKVVDLVAMGGILPGSTRRRPYGPRYVTGAVLARGGTKMLGTQSEHDNTESLFQPRKHPAKLPTDLLTLSPFSGVHAREPWLLGRRRREG